MNNIDFEKCNSELLGMLPKDQFNKVMSQKECDIDTSFLGFVNYYLHLAMIIPKNFTIVDLGCAYNPQCFFFKDHKKYIAVDACDMVKFKSDNCEIINKTIEQYIKEDISNLNLDSTFAICNFVPPWGGDNLKMVREAFKNLFVFYPCDSGFTLKD